MNIYNCIIDVAKYYCKNKNVKEYLIATENVYKLRNDMTYYAFFDILERFSVSYFYAPNIAMQFIEKVIKNKDYKNGITEEMCIEIRNNKVIKKYVELSTKINTLVLEIVKSILTSLDERKSSEEEYVFNKCSDEIGYIGFSSLVRTFIPAMNTISEYEKERNKIVNASMYLFPYEILRSGLYQESLKNGNSEIIKCYENFNIILTILNILMYACICDRVCVLKKEDIKIFNSKRKNNVHMLKFEYDDILGIIHRPIVYVIEGEVLFFIRYTYNLMNNKSTCEVFSIDFDKKDSLFNFSIDSLSILL